MKFFGNFLPLLLKCCAKIILTAVKIDGPLISLMFKFDTNWPKDEFVIAPFEVKDLLHEGIVENIIDVFSYRIGKVRNQLAPRCLCKHTKIKFLSSLEWVVILFRTPPGWNWLFSYHEGKTEDYVKDVVNLINILIISVIMISIGARNVLYLPRQQQFQNKNKY